MAITLKAMRYNRGLRQAEAADLIGINPATLSAWENGKTSPSARHLMKMCEVYACQAEDIFLPNGLTNGQEEE